MRTRGIIDVPAMGKETGRPVLVLCGWGALPPVFREIIKHLAVRGRRVICISYPRFGMWRRDASSHCPPDQMRKARTILQWLDELGIDQVDVLAHSESAVVAIAAARLSPERFGVIVPVCGAGLIGGESWGQLVGRAISHRAKQKVRDTLVDLVRAKTRKTALTSIQCSLRYFFANPMRALREVIGLAGCQIYPWIDEVRASGVRVVPIFGVDDPVFPMELAQLAVHGHRVDGFVSVRGSHNQLLRQPEQFAPAIFSIFQAFAP